jgi:hypothetical protein
MEDGEEIQGIPGAVAMPASLGSRSKRKKMPNNRGHGGRARGRGRGSANQDTVFIFVEDLICSLLPGM